MIEDRLRDKTRDKKVHLIFLFVAISFIGIGFYTLYITRFDLAIACASIVIACVSIRVSIRSQWIGDDALDISKDSIGISLKSDRRVREIGNSIFLGIVSQFEDRRLDIKIDSQLIHINLWKALVDLRQAKSMIEYSDIDRKHFNTLGNRYIQLLIQVNIQKIKEMLLCEDIQHILHMHLLIKSFRIDRNIKRKATIQLKKLLGLKERITYDYIGRMISNINEDNRWLLFIDRREEIIYR